MNERRIIYHIALADFLERVRRYSFLVTMMFALYLGYAAATGLISIRLGDSRGVYTSAWIGTLMTVVTTTFAGIAGFYIVKNAIDRDRVTRVGEILAATPIKKSAYALGKFLSNFAVLESMVAVIALTAVAMKLIIREDPQFNLWALWAPFIFLATPSMAIVAAIAVLFESVNRLRGGLGNVAYYFLWTFAFSTIAFTKSCWLDPFGVLTVFTAMTPAAAANIPGYRNNDFSITIETTPVKLVPSFRWQGIPWTAELIASRVMWIGIAILIALLAAFFFDRFDSDQVKTPRKAVKTDDPEPAASIGRPRPAGTVHLTPLDPGAVGFNFFHMLMAELRLALRGISWWWYAVAAGLVVAQILSPLEISRGPLLGVAWLWPVLIWSAMGVRESRNGTGQLIFSAAKILPRQLPACWMAGVVIAMAVGCGAVIRLALAGEIWGVAAWIAGALFIPTFALALGVWSGSSRPFEALYTMLWYVGPLNRVPGLDFTGSADGALVAWYACLYFMIAAGMLVAAFAGRVRQLRAG
jgi:hypothetical protein